MKNLIAFFAFVGGLLMGAATLMAAPDGSGGIKLKNRLENNFKLSEQTFYRLSFQNRIGSVDQAEVFSSEQAGSTADANVPHDFTRIYMAGYTFTKRVGFPQLPVRVEMIEVPQGATPRVEYTHVAYKDIDLAGAGYAAPLYPVQPPVSKSARSLPDFQYDKEAYARNGFVSDRDGASALVEVNVLGEMRGTRLAKMEVKPFQYNAATHTLRVYTALDFEIVFDNADLQATYDKKNRYYSPVFEYAQQKVLNPVSLKKYLAAQSKGDVKADLYARPMRYVIVADAMFKDSLQKFVNWKTRMGYEVIQAYTDQPEVGQSKESIRAYLKDLYDNATPAAPAPSYVLFVGDLGQIPTQKYSGTSSWGDDGHYSDLYLCEYTGDHFPDVHYGRMSAASVSELMPQINKTIYMESIKPGKTAFLDTTVIIAGMDANFGRSHLNPTVNYIHSLYMFDTLQRHAHKYLYPESGSKSEDIIQQINNGISVIIYTAHGSTNSWADPYISNSDVARLTNKDKYPLMIGNCCLTGSFDISTCFGEALLRREDAGAVVYIGGSNSTYFDQDVYWSIGYTSNLSSSATLAYENTGKGSNDMLYHTHGEPYEDWALTAYDIIYAGNMEVERANSGLEEYYWQVYHLFGDPSYIPYTHRPTEIDVDCEPSIVLGESSFRVVTVPYARVSLSRDGHVFGSAVAARDGLAELTVEGLDDPGLVNLTVVAQNRIPYHGTVEAIIPSEKYLVVSSQEVLDEAGNTVTKGLYGERYKVRCTIRNVGTKAIEETELKLVSQDQYLRVEDSGFVVSQTIQPGQEMVLEHDFVLCIDKNVPNRYTVRYALEMVMENNAEETLSRAFSFLVEAPELQVWNFVIDDAEGSVPNGVIDNGETVKAFVTFVNPGTIEVADVKLRISSPAPYLYFPDTVFDLGTIINNERKTVAFMYSAASEPGEYYSIYSIDFEFESKGRSMKDKVRSYITPVVETFESGDFSFVDWDKNSDWVIDKSRVHQGAYSVASATIGDNQTSTLQIEVDVPMDDKVGFYYFTSSESLNSSLGDFLVFYIDGVRMNRWAGEAKEWKYAEFSLTEGVHTLTWTYTKDGSEAKGEDKVWLDDIRLPIGSHAPIGVANETECVQDGNTSVMQVLRSAAGTLEVRFTAAESLSGNLYVINAMGQRVKVLASDLRLDAGTQTASFGISGWPAGVYVLVLETSRGNREAAKFVIAR
ncbi:MAG: hypothetical protein K2L50_00240 [Bacteroidales bacterium]|nr:hypothetical protein [Bacteroidales bacterium]